MIEQAAFWAAQLATDEATQADHDACAAWCGEHPLHRLAMERMRGFDMQIDDADEIGREAIESMLEKRSRSGLWLGGLTIGLAALAGGGWLAAQSLAVRALFPDYETVRGEQRSVTLADGSDLAIDTDAALDFDRSDKARTVTLFRGRILARVATEPAHPFVVDTPDGTATALGTAFTVHRNTDATTVTVLESSVRVCPAKAADSGCTDLLPGDRARMTQARLERLGRMDPETAGMWATGWLVADDQPVTHVLTELNRYRKEPVRFDPADLAGIRVSGSFPLADPDRALDGILKLTRLRMSGSGEEDRRVYRAK